MTVSGAARIFGALVGAARAASLCLPSALLTQTKRAGQQLAEVGPNFIRSYSSRNCSSLTGRSVHALRVRALRQSRSRAELSSLSDKLSSVDLNRAPPGFGGRRSSFPSVRTLEPWPVRGATS